MNKDRIVYILNLVKTEIEDYDDLITSGICGELDHLKLLDIITKEEKQHLKALLHRNKPDEHQFTEFTNNEYWKPNNAYWWSPVYREIATAQIRVDYLAALIKKIEDEQSAGLLDSGGQTG